MLPQSILQSLTFGSGCIAGAALSLVAIPRRLWRPEPPSQPRPPMYDICCWHRRHLALASLWLKLHREGERLAPDPFEPPADSPLWAVLRELRNALNHDMVSVLNVFANSGETN